MVCVVVVGVGVGVDLGVLGFLEVSGVGGSVVGEDDFFEIGSRGEEGGDGREESRERGGG